MSEYLLVYVTAASLEEADTIARELVARRLVACANIVPDIRSVFWWENTVEHEHEVLLIFKSTAARFASLVEAVKSLHSYDVPEIIAMPIVLGSDAYLAWITAETQSFPA